jgi:hypothetical protein
MELGNITMDVPSLEALINTQISARKQRMEKMSSLISNEVNTKLKKIAYRAPPNARTKKMGKPKSNSPRANTPIKDTNKNKQLGEKARRPQIVQIPTKEYRASFLEVKKLIKILTVLLLILA